MYYGGTRFKNDDYRKKLTQGLKVSVRPNLAFTAHNVRRQTGTEEPYLIKSDLFFESVDSVCKIADLRDTVSDFRDLTDSVC